MKAFVIAITKWPVSMKYGQRALRSLQRHGLPGELFEAVTPETLEAAEQKYRVRPRTRFQTRLMQDPASNPFMRACFMSHFTLWHRCVQHEKPIVIVEHDTVMTRDWDNPQFSGDVLNLNVLRTKAGSVPDTHFAPPGIHSHAADFNRGVIDRIDGQDIEAGRMNGAHFYIIKPQAAAKLIEITERDGYINPDDMINEHYLNVEYVSPVYGKISGNLYSSLGWKSSNRFAWFKLAGIAVWKTFRR